MLLRLSISSFRSARRQSKSFTWLPSDAGVVSVTLHYKGQALALAATRDLCTPVFVWGLRLGLHTLLDNNLLLGCNCVWQSSWLSSTLCSTLLTKILRGIDPTAEEVKGREESSPHSTLIHLYCPAQAACPNFQLVLFAALPRDCFYTVMGWLQNVSSARFKWLAAAGSDYDYCSSVSFVRDTGSCRLPRSPTPLQNISAPQPIASANGCKMAATPYLNGSQLPAPPTSPQPPARELPGPGDSLDCLVWPPRQKRKKCS